jgi:hypothetical protein
MVPKKGGSYRLIHHLSHPLGTSVNDVIDKKYCIKYARCFGPRGDGGTSRYKNAFRLLPVHKSDFQLLGFKIQGKIFVDKCLPFGCSVSCSKFKKNSTFFEWVLKQQTNSSNVIHYLDDFLVTGNKGTDDCARLMTNFSFICSDLGVPLAHKKSIGPTTNLVFWGLEIDTISMTIRIPQD